MTTPDTQPTSRDEHSEKRSPEPCADRVRPAFESRIAWLGDLLAAYSRERRECETCSGSGEVVTDVPVRKLIDPAYHGDGLETDACDDCDGDGDYQLGDEDGRLTRDTEHAEAGECIHEAGLAFDYVESDGDYNDGAPYFRFQLSCGGPSDEFRFYVGYGDTDYYRVEFWFLDWFDGASVDCSNDERVRELWSYLSLDGDPDHLRAVAEGV